MPEASLTLAEYNALIAQCGCCELPRCCPPLLECQSLHAHFTARGYTSVNDSAAWPKHRKWGTRTTATGSWSQTGPNPHNSGTSTYQVWTVSAEAFRGIEIERTYSGGVTPVEGSGSSSGPCPHWPVPNDVVACAASGAAASTNYTWVFWGGGTPEQPAPHADFAASMSWSESISSAEGETTEIFAAWRGLYPTDADYEAALEAYGAYIQAYDGWMDSQPLRDSFGSDGEFNAALEAWEAAAPDSVDEPAARPSMEVYPKCWFRITTTYVIHPHYFGKYSDGSSAEPEEPSSTVQEWLDGGGSGSPPCSGTGTLSRYTDAPISSISKPPGTAIEADTEFLEPFTRDEWRAEVAAVVDDLVGDFPDEGCYLAHCGASRQVTEESYSEIAFRYRFKLNKCCGYRNILSGWREVFFTQEYIDWHNLITGPGSSVTIPPPPVDLDAISPHKEWLWEGIPPLCPQGSSSASSSEETDPYDEESMWSPFSLTVRVPPGEYGHIVLRNYQQKCYGTLFDLMPRVTGEVDLSDSVPDAP